jgi:hypothetical protein
VFIVVGLVGLVLRLMLTLFEFFTDSGPAEEPKLSPESLSDYA